MAKFMIIFAVLIFIVLADSAIVKKRPIKVGQRGQTQQNNGINSDRPSETPQFGQSKDGFALMQSAGGHGKPIGQTEQQSGHGNIEQASEHHGVQSGRVEQPRREHYEVPDLGD